MTETLNKYESVLVVSAKLSEEEVAAVVAKFKALIEANAVFENVVEWGKRRLAYEINKETEAFYFLFNFESNESFPAELDRVYNITDGVVRSMIIRKDV